MKRLTKAFIYSFSCSVLSIIVIVMIVGVLSMDDGWFIGWLTSVGFTILLVYSIFVFLGLVFVALPLHAVFQRLSIRSPLPYCFVGFSIPLGIVGYFHPYGLDPLPQLVTQAVLSGIVGLVCAFVFWRYSVGDKPR